MSKIYNRRCLITGCAGSIGSELCRQLCKNNKIFGIDQNESEFFNIQQETGIFGRVGDIRNKETVFDIFSDFKPQIVINCAALKHVSMSQIYPREYVMTNILGNLNLIEESKRWECLERFVFISTDKVVSGNKNVMGATKMCSESITTSMGEKFIAVRFGNVLYSRGSVLEIWKKQVQKKEPITITNLQMERYIMTIPDACSLVIKATECGTGGQVWCLDMGKLKKIIDLKNELYGKNYPIKIIGIRKGESMSENLMTKEEKKIAKKVGRFFVINKL